MLTAEEIEAAALQLPEDELRPLVHRLLRHQAERRLDAIYAGRAPAIPFDDLLTELERDL
jgi:hypothetical protein